MKTTGKLRSNAAVAMVVAAALAIPGSGALAAEVLKDRECVLDCRVAYKSCSDAARDSLRLCTAGTCRTETAAVRAACPDGAFASEDCLVAAEALRVCLAPCYQAFRKDRSDCRTGSANCVSRCPDRGSVPAPAPKDSTCLAACRVELGGCRAGSTAEFESCNAGCAGLVQSAATVCATKQPAACRSARQAAAGCTDRCDLGSRTSSTACSDANRECISLCPNRTLGARPLHKQVNR